ncbi:MAG: hypothetical protein JSS02_17885 [Planctomycetes bacterium]|nr:hypothetical protein [Planctomycetota bacterium]
MTDCGRLSRFGRTVCLLIVIGPTTGIRPVAAEDAPQCPKRVAAVVTEYRHNSHADVICSRLFQTQTLDDKGERLQMQLVSVYTDQRPDNDTSRKWAQQYQFRISETVADALTLGTDQLAVDGILLVAEHGNYPRSESGQTIYPKRRLFTAITDVLRQQKKSVPIFIDKHLADNWEDARFIYDTARELKIPLMAGSSLPNSWRDPQIDVRRHARLKQIVGCSYGGLDSYGFHGLEIMQALAERRLGGETGVSAVKSLSGQAVWEAAAQGVYDPELLRVTLSRLKRPPAADKKLSDLVREPVLFVVDYRDGLRVCLFTLNGAVSEWAGAWRYADESVESANFLVQESRPFMHFAWLVAGVDRMLQTGTPTWSVERTLLTSGTLDALLISLRDQNRQVATPYLNVTYENPWNWKQPPPAPPDRPAEGQ